MIRVSNKIGMTIWLGIIILRYPEKAVPWKFWLDPRFLRNSKRKWILKWLTLDRGCFKFYFLQKEKVLLIISWHMYLSIRNLVVSFQVIIYIAMHFVLIKLSRNLWLLIDDPSKRGDVKTLARSSVFPSPQVKMKLKLTASR